jgi:hypothetical protein
VDKNFYDSLLVDLVIDRDSAEFSLYQLTHELVKASKEKNNEFIDEMIVELEKVVTSNNVSYELDRDSFLLGQIFMLSAMANKMKEMDKIWVDQEVRRN